ncbi:VCBS domain-containing protein [Paracoccus denitrificans]|uniref:Ig-like domain-containing protein n=1 Tax=Paracoccus denitrificans TaxID=266 RepID=UPI000317ECC6|nr:VCBS domain-containing protein [Paracoccus denitrificans]MBB4629689.1 VCBS repeat-containing protein [Paracoccus denitrificans]MCU7431105.1 VCBS domain-containing protein [Paracoccus denitrificans]UPV94744.1 VCBS domain-containing protein [Paracoccus denitrificans]WQO33207.1 VCBS domain-containing protein [Paracoccus denitrificans]SDJ87130.1 VCBS repeat-containing protein [Paracoccus denitrificans]
MLGDTEDTYNFTVDPGTLTDLEIDIHSASWAAILDNVSIVLQKQNPDGSWTTVADNSSTGLIDLIGIFGQTTTIAIDGLTEGSYRFTMSNWSLVTLPGSVSADFTFTNHNLDTLVDTVAAEGNLFDDNGNGGDVVPAGTELSIFDLQGNEITVNSTVNVTGQYGTLTVHSDGSYSYEPFEDGTNIGQQDVFTYKLTNGGQEDTATLTINIVEADNLPEDASAAMATFLSVDDGEIPSDWLGEGSDDAEIPAPAESDVEPVATDFLASTEEDLHGTHTV